MSGAEAFGDGLGNEPVGADDLPVVEEDGALGGDDVVNDAEIVDGDEVAESGAGSPRRSPGSGDELTVGDLFEAEFARVSAERDEYLDALQRLQADFENFRRRSERQQAEARERGSEAVIHRLLPALDALDLALAHVGERESANTSELEPAFIQIANLLRDVLAKEGVVRIDATGVEFDPTVHDAVAHEAAADGTPGGEPPSGVPSVVETLRAGYRLGDRVLRPAMVKVRA